MKLFTAFVISATLLVTLFTSIYKIDAITKSHRHVDKVYLYLQWFDQAQFAGFYTAAGKRFYDEANIDVEIIPRPTNVQQFYAETTGKEKKTMPNLTKFKGDWNVPAVVSASSDLEKPAAFGVWTGDQVLSKYDHDHLDIRAIGTVFDRSLACFIVREDSAIFSPKDFGGKRIGIYEGYDTEIIYKWMISKYPPSTPPTPVKLDPKNNNLQLLESGDIAVLPAYAINEPIEASLQKQPFKFRIIYPDYYNIDYYSDTLITNRNVLEKNPDLVKRFLEASERGWRWAFDHPDEAVKFVIEEDDEKKLTGKTVEQLLMLNRASFYVRTSNPMFSMSPDNWNFMSHVLKTQGLINQDDGCGELCNFDIAWAAHKKEHVYAKD